jgi:hypothetical protein
VQKGTQAPKEVTFIKRSSQKDLYTAVLTRRGRIFFYNLMNIDCRSLCSILVESCSSLIDYYAKMKLQGSVEFIAHGGYEEELAAVQDTRSKEIHEEVFSTDPAGENSLVDFKISEEFFGLMDQLWIMGDYEHPEELYSHVVRYAWWRARYKRTKEKQSIH